MGVEKRRVSDEKILIITGVMWIKCTVVKKITNVTNEIFTYVYIISISRCIVTITVQQNQSLGVT